MTGPLISLAAMLIFGFCFGDDIDRIAIIGGLIFTDNSLIDPSDMGFPDEGEVK